MLLLELRRGIVVALQLRVRVAAHAVQQRAKRGRHVRLAPMSSTSSASRSARSGSPARTAASAMRARTSCSKLAAWISRKPSAASFRSSSASSNRPARAAARPRLRRLIIESPTCPAVSTVSCTARKSSSASIDAALVGQDLADVVHRHRDARHVADPLEERSTPLVDLERSRPLAFPVEVDPEVVELRRLSLEVAEILEDRERKPPEGDALRRP